MLALLLATRAVAQTTPTDIRVLKEERNANGETVRTIQYMLNGRRVVESSVLRPVARLNVPLKADTLDPQHLLVVITKSRYVLDVFYRRAKVRSYKVVFGPRPMENKMMKGDRRTPEGWYRIDNKHISGQYNRFMHIDYPNDSSMIRFELLKRRGTIPPNAELGGDVGIHGVWKGGDDMIENGVGWTDGCIALKNKDMDELYSLVPVGVRVLIRR
jgi:murein L,D-transpeptidase YafK